MCLMPLYQLQHILTSQHVRDDHHLLKYMVISEWQRYRYVANEGTLHLDHIYLDVMRSVIKKLWGFHHLSIYMIEHYVTSLRYHHSHDDYLSHAVR